MVVRSGEEIRLCNSYPFYSQMIVEKESGMLMLLLPIALFFAAKGSPDVP